MLALPARNLIEVTINNDEEFVDSEAVGTIVNPKQRRKELNDIGNDLLQYFGGLFLEKLDGSEPNKSKDVIKQDNQELDVKEQGYCHSKTYAKMLEKSNGGNMFSDNMELDENAPNRSYFKEEKNPEDNSFMENYLFVNEEEHGSAFSSLISADVAFD
ncbi:hypothetical protein RJ641_002173 [Dillenia turbinata]|uniref:Uncharacterized protein n=1 Tax=Dillenia turbinata TaxID=194707 RepID=A0AAN8ZA69_9MAGN